MSGKAVAFRVFVVLVIAELAYLVFSLTQAANVDAP